MHAGVPQGRWRSRGTRGAVPPGVGPRPLSRERNKPSPWQWLGTRREAAAAPRLLGAALGIRLSVCPASGAQRSPGQLGICTAGAKRGKPQALGCATAGECFFGFALRYCSFFLFSCIVSLPKDFQQLYQAVTMSVSYLEGSWIWHFLTMALPSCV